MKKLLLFAMLLATVAMTSCSKSSSTPTLVGKWKLTSYVYKVGTFTETYTGVAADYVEFKSNGTAISFIDGETRNSSYTISGSNLNMDGQTYSISLSSSTATLYYTELVSGTRYEETINLRK